jgi:hypothetical protein
MKKPYIALWACSMLMLADAAALLLAAAGTAPDADLIADDVDAEALSRGWR